VAKFNEILVGRYNRLLQKLFSIKGTAPVPVLSTEVQPAISLFGGAELRYLEGWDLFGNGALIAGVVAQNSGVRLRNPLGSNIIVVVMKALFEVDAVSLLIGRIGAINTDLNLGVLSSGRWDARTQRTSSIAQFSTGNAAPSFGGVMLSTEIDAADFHFHGLESNVEIPLLPGDSLQFDTATSTNQVLRPTLWWRERFLEESERT